MEVPAFFASYENGNLSASDGIFGAVAPKRGNRFMDLGSAVSSSFQGGARHPVMVIDCNSFERRDFSEKVMKNLKLPSAEIWFMTYIETVDDVFDSFNKDAELVFAPYHFIDGDAELKDINDVSDSVVPVIFVHKGRGVLQDGKKDDVVRILEKLVSLGFYKNSVMDAGGGLDARTWEIIADDYPSTIPIVSGPDAPPGFESTVIPYLL